MASMGGGGGGGEPQLMGNGVPKFLLQLRAMLDNSDGAITWSNDGTMIVVNNVPHLESVILPR